MFYSYIADLVDTNNPDNLDIFIWIYIWIIIFGYIMEWENISPKNVGLLNNCSDIFFLRVKNTVILLLLLRYISFLIQSNKCYRPF